MILHACSQLKSHLDISEGANRVEENVFYQSYIR